MLILSPNWLRLCRHARRGMAWTYAHAISCVIVFYATGQVATAQPDRQAYLGNEPLAAVEVQSLNAPKEQDYTNRSPQMMYQPLSEDPLSFYVRTQDGEWQIPTQVNPEDPWVRLLILGPSRPTIADVSIDINQRPFRAAREGWIDKLLAEAKATFLVRTGEAAADAVGIEASSNVQSEAPADDAKTDKAEVGENSDLPDSSDEPSEGIASAGETDKSETGEDDASEDVTNNEAEIPMVAAQSRQTSSLFKRLINYLAADQSTAEREEVRWLLAEWTGGPALMTLSPAFAWRRADAAPLWHALDLDGDQVVSSHELSETATTLKKADINRDEILSLAELERLSQQHSGQQQTNGYPLVVVIDDHTDWKALRRHLRTAYPKQGDLLGESPLLNRIANGDRSLGVADLANLLSLTPDLVYRVGFANEGAKVELLAVGGESAGEVWGFRSSTERAITVERRETYMELTAAQGKLDEENASGDMQQTQISIGAVVDGFPLFRLLDHDNNRQLTLRERRNIVEFLKDLDLNDDGQIDRSEIPTAIRLAVTHGPQSHVHLAQAIAAQREHGKPGEEQAPEWFVGMDRNKDGDLSRREFQGSPRQFAKYDRDKDGLISRLEVQQSSGKN